MIAAPTSSIEPQSPWPGLASFGEADAAFFFGRDREAADLVRIVKREPVTVLFGLSGLGKTSLLRAAVFPRLREDGFFPVPLRLDHATGAAPLVDQLFDAVAREAARHGVDHEPRRPDETLWAFFHRVPFFDQRNRLLVPVLVVDQFEEIFTLGRGRAAVGSFIEALADLVENRIPRAVREAQGAAETLPAFRDAPKVRVVLGIREDYLAQLDDLRASLPSVANRYRLRQLDGRQALSAVAVPGEQVIDAATAEQVVRFVAARHHATDRGAPASLEDLEVEPALLSLVCAELNAIRRARGEPRIDVALLSGEASRVLADFYERCIGDLPAAVRCLVEEKLLTADGHRTTLALTDALRAPGVGAEAVEQLVRRRLLRVEERLGLPHVELVHDKLCQVIQAARDRRRENAARRRLRWRLAVGGAAALLVASLATAYAIRQRNKASEILREIIEAGRRKVGQGALSNAASLLRVASLVAPDAGDRPKDLTLMLDRLLRQTEGLVAVLQPAGGVTEARFSADGALLATAGRDGRVTIWDAAAWKEDAARNVVATLEPPLQEDALAHSGGSAEAAGAGASTQRPTDDADVGTVRSDQRSRTDGNPRHQPGRSALARSPIEALWFLRSTTGAAAPWSHVLASYRDGQAALWALGSLGGRVERVPGLGERRRVVAVLATGGRFLACGAAGCREHSIVDGRLTEAAGPAGLSRVIALHGGRGWALVEPGSITLVTAEGTRRLELESGASRDRRRPEARAVDALGDVVAFTLEGAVEEVVIDQARLGRRQLAIPGQVRGLALLAGGARVWLTLADGTGELWDTQRGQRLRSFATAGSPRIDDGRHLVFQQADQVRVVDAGTGLTVARAPTLFGASVRASPGGQVLGVGGSAAWVWDPSHHGADFEPTAGEPDEELPRVLAIDRPVATELSRMRSGKVAWREESDLVVSSLRTGRTERLNHPAFLVFGDLSDDGHRAVTVTSDGGISTWDIEQEPAVLQSRWRLPGARGVDATPDGSVVVARAPRAGAEEFCVRRQLDGTVSCHRLDGLVRGWVLAQDGKTVALVQSNTCLALLDLASGRVSRPALQPGTTWLRFLDPGRLITIGRSGEAVVLDPTGQALARFHHGANLVSAAVFPGAKPLVATAGEDQTLRIWSPDGQRLAELPGVSAEIVRFADQGRLVVVWSRGRARVLAVGTKRPIGKRDFDRADFDELQGDRFAPFAVVQQGSRIIALRLPTLPTSPPPAQAIRLRSQTGQAERLGAWYFAMATDRSEAGWALGLTFARQGPSPGLATSGADAASAADPSPVLLRDGDGGGGTSTLDAKGVLRALQAGGELLEGTPAWGGHLGRITAVATGADGEWFTGGEDGQILRWRLDPAGRPTVGERVRMPGDPVTGLSCGTDGTLLAWSGHRLERRAAGQVTTLDAGAPIDAAVACPSGRLFVTVRGQLISYDPDLTERWRTPIAGAPSRLALEPGGDRIAVWYPRYDNVSLWESLYGHRVAELRTLGGAAVRGVVARARGRLELDTSIGLQAWSERGGSWSGLAAAPLDIPDTFRAELEDGGVRILRRSNVAQWDVTVKPATALALRATPGGPRLAWIDGDRRLRVSDAQGKDVAPPFQLDAPPRRIEASFDAAGERLVVMTDASLLAWDLRSTRPTRLDVGAAGAFQRALIDPTGTRVLWSSEDRNWTLTGIDGRPIAPPLWSGDAKDVAAFAPGGDHILLGAKLLDGEGRLVARLDVAPEAAAFTRSGRWLAVRTGGELRLYSMNPGPWPDQEIERRTGWLRALEQGRDLFGEDEAEELVTRWKAEDDANRASGPSRDSAR